MDYLKALPLKIGVCLVLGLLVSALAAVVAFAGAVVALVALPVLVLAAFHPETKIELLCRNGQRFGDASWGDRDFESDEDEDLDAPAEEVAGMLEEHVDIRTLN